MPELHDFLVDNYWSALQMKMWSTGTGYNKCTEWRNGGVWEICKATKKVF